MFSLLFWYFLARTRERVHVTHAMHSLYTSEWFHRCGKLTAFFIDGLIAHIVFTLFAPHIFGALGLDDVLGGVLVPHTPGSPGAASVEGGH